MTNVIYKDGPCPKCRTAKAAICHSMHCPMRIIEQPSSPSELSQLSNDKFDIRQVDSQNVEFIPKTDLTKAPTEVETHAGTLHIGGDALGWQKELDKWIENDKKGIPPMNGREKAWRLKYHGVTPSEPEKPDFEWMALNALKEIHMHTQLCINKEEENIFIQGYNAARKRISELEKERDELAQKVKELEESVSKLSEGILSNVKKHMNH